MGPKIPPPPCQMCIPLGMEGFEYQDGETQYLLKIRRKLTCSGASEGNNHEPRFLTYGSMRFQIEMISIWSLIPHRGATGVVNSLWADTSDNVYRNLHHRAVANDNYAARGDQQESLGSLPWVPHGTM